MSNLRKSVAAAIAALGLAFGATAAVAPSASAASAITTTGSCSVSANWSIALSVRWYNTGGSPSTGEVVYAVMSSPGPLSLTSSLSAAYENGANAPVGFQGWVRDTSKPGYVYRSDAGAGFNGTRSVRFNPRTSASQTFCSDYSQAARVYSQN